MLVHGRGSLCRIKGCDAMSNGEMGVGVQKGGEARIEKSRISNNKHAGLFVDGSESRAAVKDCELLSNGVRGVGVQSGAELQITGSLIGQNGQEGIFVSGHRSRAHIQDSNVVSQNGTKGIGVQSAAVAIIHSSRIEKNVEEGVFLSDAGSQVIDLSRPLYARVSAVQLSHDIGEIYHSVVARVQSAAKAIPHCRRYKASCRRWNFEDQSLPSDLS